MKLMLNPDFEKYQVKPGLVNLVETDFSHVVSGPITSAVAGVSAAVVGHSKPSLSSTLSLQKTYLEGTWSHHMPGQKLVTMEDFENMCDALTMATRRYVTEEQGISLVSLPTYKPMAIAEILKTLDIITPNLIWNVTDNFNKTLLAEAVFLRACEDYTWLGVWHKFTDALVGNAVQVKCDETNNTPEDAKQGKLNVDLFVPVAEHIELDVVIGPSGEKVLGTETGNQPVPCGPPIVAAKKVSTIDKFGYPIIPPGSGWWVGDDMCWHPPEELGKKILVAGKPQHLVDFENQMIEGMTESLKHPPNWPVDVKYIPTGTPADSPDLQSHFSLEAEKDLQQAMVDEVKKQIDQDMLGQIGMPVTEKMGDDVLAYAKKAFVKAMQIPPHLLGVQVNTK